MSNKKRNSYTPLIFFDTFITNIISFEIPGRLGSRFQSVLWQEESPDSKRNEYRESIRDHGGSNPMDSAAENNRLP